MNEENDIEKKEALVNEAEKPETSAEPVSTEESNSSKLITSMLTDDEDSIELKRWQDLARSMNINGEWFRRQIGVISLIVLATIVYITNRYQAQQEIIDEENLREELQDWKFRSLTRSSELTLKCRQSKLEEQLKMNGDSTLHTSSEAPFRIFKDVQSE